MEVIKFNPSDNPALIFAGVVKRVKLIAKENNVADSVAIEAFIQDLQNLNKEEYQKKIEGITIKEMPDYIKKALIDYLQKVLREQKKIEKKQAKKPEQESRRNEREAEKKARRKKEAEESAAKAEKERIEKRQRKIQTALAEIYAIVEDESKKKKIPKRDILIKIRNDRFASKKTLSKEEEMIKKELDDEIFYEEVKYYTRDFEFLVDNKLVADAILGYTGRKFKDFQSFERFNTLKSRILNGANEEKEIKKILTQNVDKVTKRILEQRMKIIELGKKRKTTTNIIER